MQNIHFPFPREKSEYWEQPYLPHTDDLHTFPEPSWMQLWYIHSQYWMSHGNHFSIASRRKISSISHQHKGMPSSPSEGLKQKKDLHSPLFPSYLFLLGCLVVCFLLGFFFCKLFRCVFSPGKHLNSLLISNATYVLCVVFFEKMAMVDHLKATLEVTARITHQPTTAEHSIVLKWISISVTDFPMQYNVPQLQ